LSAPPTERIVFSTTDEHGIAILNLNRVDRKNALGKQLSKELVEELEMLSKQAARIRVMILRSLVPGIFCAGADLKERLDMREDEVAKASGLNRDNFALLADLPFPTIAAIDGHALGGGLEMSLACDLRVAATGAKLGLVETRLAIIPGAGGSQRLPRTVGVAKAKELIFTGCMIDAWEACKIGLINYAVEQNCRGNASFEKSLSLAKDIAQNGPIALKAAKEAIDKGIENSLSKALEIEGECYQKVIPTRDRIEALEAFVSKRKPRYEGH